MLSKIEKWLDANSSEDTSRFHWCRTALWIAPPVFCVTFGAIALLLKFQVESSLIAGLYLGLIPLHVATFGSALFVLFSTTPPKERLWRLQLRPVLKPVTDLLSPTASMLVLIFPASFAVATATKTIADLLGLPLPSQSLIELFRDSLSLHVALIIAISSLVIAPITEEILFRLTLYEGLRSMQIPAAGLFTSAIFAISHGLCVQMPALFLLGIGLQRLRGKTRTLWAPILLHSASNAISLLLLALGSQWV